MFGFMIIRKREYEELYDAKDNLNDRLKDQRRIYEDQITETMKESQKYQDEATKKRNQIRMIKRIIKAEKEAQQYGSVMNALNRLETAIEKIETGE